jgi:hypothetical protein
MSQLPTTVPTNANHYANPMVHPVTGVIVSSYKKAMHDKDIGTLWQTAFGKEFGGLAQGDIRTKTIGTNAIFVMTHSDIKKHKGKYKFPSIRYPLFWPVFNLEQWQPSMEGGKWKKIRNFEWN